MTSPYFTPTPDETRQLECAILSIKKSIQLGFDDLRCLQEVVAIGIPRLFAQQAFEAVQGEYARQVCLRCETCFRPLFVSQLKSRVCPACRRDGHGGLITPAERLKQNARAAANMAVSRGRLKRQPCSTCGADKAEKHHNDYSKPLDVTWLCRTCHMNEHYAEDDNQKVARET